MIKNLPANAGDARDASSIPGLISSPGGGKLQLTPAFFSLKNSMDKRSLAGYSSWDQKELDPTEHTHKWGFTITCEEQIRTPQLSTQSPLPSDTQSPSFIYVLQFPSSLFFFPIHFLWKPSLTPSGTLSFQWSNNISYRTFACIPDRLNQS